MFADFIEPYFLEGADQQRPVTVDDLFTVASPDGMQQVQFKVVEMEIGKGQSLKALLVQIQHFTPTTDYASPTR